MKEALVNRIKNQYGIFVIAGPCSAETETQVSSITKDIVATQKVNMLRAGIWKPRTHPNSFEGLGEEALQWLVDSGKRLNTPTCTEVANKSHVEAALKAGVDALWIGARTTVNPFAVQEIADVVKGTTTPILIKNPVNPDLELWLGAFERFNNAGLDDLTAIHRGFSVYNHVKYRNVPSWEIPIAFKEKRPDVPMICDPSHITGNRQLLLEVSQYALDLNFDGLMIETHPNPDDAWSDAQQQLNAKELNELLKKLILRQPDFSHDVAAMIDEIRAKVSVLDDELFNLLSDRMQLSEEVGILKRENNITILQQQHWSRLISKRLNESENYHLTPQFVRTLMDAIHQESIRHQTRIMNPKTSKSS
jgi:chorismate mutase